MDQKKVLENIFKETGPVTWFGVVEARVSRQRYELADSAGRIRYADCNADEHYPKGMRVIVQNGRIIGGGQLAGSHKVFEV